MKFAELDFTPRSPALAELCQRGFIEDLSDPQAIDNALASNDPVRFYIGYDPTADSLHVGSLVCIMAMRVLQRHGHRPVVLLGGGTARVGDPSGRSEIRKMLDENTLAANLKGIGSHFERFLAMDGPVGATVVDNADWLLQQNYVTFLREIGAHFTVNRMIASKTYRDRLEAEQPLSFLEFNYQLLQAFDFLHLYRTHACTLQLGGSDQWGNLIAGVELIRRMASVHDDDEQRFERQGPAYAMTFPLLTTADGRKMGKTAQGAVWLSRDRLSPFDYYQYWINVHDRDVRKLFLTFTDIDPNEVDELCQATGAAIRDVKTKLAYEATKLCHGETAANQARTAAVQAFGAGDDWSAVPTVELEQSSIGLLDLVTHPQLGVFSSKRQARQRIEGGAIKVNGTVVHDPSSTLSRPDDGEPLRLQAGKKHRFQIVFAAP